ncbi:MAG: hypothetical protein ACLQGV_08435 [Bryobacteraceae bacterium]
MITGRFFIIRVLFGIGPLVAAGGSVLAQVAPAGTALVRFCELDLQGEQLTPEGWQKVAALFERPGAPRRDEIIVVKDFGGSRPIFEKGRAGFYVEYVELGRIDLLNARFSSPLPPGIKVRAEFHLTKQPAGGSSRAGEWRIEGPVPEPHVGVDAAIRCATELRAKAKDAAIKKNADRTLTALGRFR